MTDTERKALALMNEVRAERQYGPEGWYDGWRDNDYQCEALCRAIEQHEAFRQEVSDALSVYQKADGVEERSRIWDALTRFIIPQPDPIAEAWIEATGNTVGMEPLNAALTARGLKIVEDK